MPKHPPQVNEEPRRSGLLGDHVTTRTKTGLNIVNSVLRQKWPGHTTTTPVYAHSATPINEGGFITEGIHHLMRDYPHIPLASMRAGGFDILDSEKQQVASVHFYVLKPSEAKEHPLVLINASHDHRPLVQDIVRALSHASGITPAVDYLESLPTARKQLSWLYQAAQHAAKHTISPELMPDGKKRLKPLKMKHQEKPKNKSLPGLKNRAKNLIGGKRKHGLKTLFSLNVSSKRKEPWKWALKEISIRQMYHPFSSWFFGAP